VRKRDIAHRSLKSAQLLDNTVQALMGSAPPFLQILNLGFQCTRVLVPGLELHAQFGIFTLKQALAFDQLGHDNFEPPEIVMRRIHEFWSRIVGDGRLPLSVLDFGSRSS
jgi:hypothetical protein